MIFSLTAVYLKAILGVATGWIGFLEGFVEASSYATRLISGVLSDYFRRRKFIMVLGYLFVTLTRPLFALSTSYVAVFTARFLDRLGNGIQSTPRDALVGDIAPDDIKGTCFCAKQAIGVSGSFLGGIVGVLAMDYTNSNFHNVFWLAAIPAILAVIILITFVKEPKPVPLEPGEKVEEKKIKKHPIHLSDLKRLGKYYWYLMAIVAMFMLARLGEAFLSLHATSNFNLEAKYIPFILIAYNLTYALISWPIGRLADKMNRYFLLGLGFFALIAADVILSLASNLTAFFIGVAVWGVQMGISQGIFSTLVDQTAPADLRGTAFGFFYLISAVSLLVASTLGGVLAQNFGDSMAFTYSGCVAVLSFVLLLLLPQPKFVRTK
jgi:MFS family permease